jgi:hypothetical protein
MSIDACSCEESGHLRAALKTIWRICHGETPGTPVDDLAQIANLASQGLALEPLEGDPAVYDIADVKDE